MGRREVRQATLWLMIFALVMVACASPFAITPPPSVSAPDSVETIIVKTAAAAQTQTAISLPPSSTPTPTLIPIQTKTITVTPTPTATVLLITETSLPDGSLEEAGGVESESGGGAFVNGSTASVLTDREWACRITYRSPAKGAVISRGSTFKAVWVVQNIGTKTWPVQGVDVVYATGADLHEGKPYRDIPATIGPGGKVTISITMTAPKRKGSYSTRWTLKVGKRNFCTLRLAFESR